MGDQVIASGYNCNYPGSEPCAKVGCLRDARQIPSGSNLEICMAIHAEQLAILHAANKGISLAGSTMYVNAEPCLLCGPVIAALDIEALVVLSGGYSTQEGLERVRKSGKQIRYVSPTDVL